ncbi:MAG: TonB-dependent receptor [Cytophagales bacterium]|nr:MAG: TonB-dependent receptor [Cytophagales bacterium]
MMKSIVLNFVLLFAILGTLHAQNDSLQRDVMDIDDIVEAEDNDAIKVVSASRSSKSIDDLPITIEVITHEEIVRNGYTTLVDVLKGVAGIRVSQPGNGVDGQTFLMRGLIGNYYTKILLNGIPLQPSVSGALAIAEQLPIAQAERIEIIFGPASAVYGADAMAGIINIITTTPENNTIAETNIITGDYGYKHINFLSGGKFGKDDKVVRYTLFANFGEREDLNVKYDDDNYNPLTYSLFTPQERISAFRDPNRFLSQVILTNYPYYKGTTFKAEANQMPERSYLFGLQLQYKRWQFSYFEMYRRNFSSIGLHPLVFSHHNPDIFIGDRIRRATAAYQVDWQWGSFISNVSVNSYRVDPQSARASTYDGFGGRSYKYAASDDVFLEFLLRLGTNKNWEFTLGTSVTFSSILPQTNDLERPFRNDVITLYQGVPFSPHPVYGTFGFNPYNYINGSVFAQIYKSKERWSRILGARFDRNSDFEANIQARIALQYKLSDKISIRGSLGNAFRAPSPNDTYSSTALSFTQGNQTFISYQQVPNEDLRPEVSSSFEVAARYKINSRISTELIYFTNNVLQSITGRLVPVDTLRYPNAALTDSRFNIPVTRAFINDENSRSSLISLQSIWRFRNIIPSMKMDIDAHFTFASGEEVLPDTAGTINSYRMVPDMMAQINFSFYPTKKLYLRVSQVMMTGWQRRFIQSAGQTEFERNRIEGYYTLDFLARYSMNKNLSIFAKVTNVFNTQYGGIDATGLDIDMRSNPQLGLNTQVGVTFKLN